MDQRDVRAAWQKFVERGTLSGDVRSTVAASWQRSRQHSVTVDRAKALPGEAGTTETVA